MRRVAVRLRTAVRVASVIVTPPCVVLGAMLPCPISLSLESFFLSAIGEYDHSSPSPVRDPVRFAGSMRPALRTPTTGSQPIISLL